jgi:XRE family transcriptional regulator, aerobic/anaerobic benzoate catabolism transcriptional regulator
MTSATVTMQTGMADEEDGRDPFLIALGERLSHLRSRRGLTRKALAGRANVSKRHLVNVESGVGNVSIRFLYQLTAVLNCTLVEMIGDPISQEYLIIRELLHGRSEKELAQLRSVLASVLDAPVQ